MSYGDEGKCWAPTATAAAAAFQKLELILFSTLVSVAIFVFQFPFWHRSLSLLSSIPQKDIFVSYFFFFFVWPSSMCPPPLDAWLFGFPPFSSLAKYTS